MRWYGRLFGPQPPLGTMTVEQIPAPTAAPHAAPHAAAALALVGHESDGTIVIHYTLPGKTKYGV